MHSTEKAPNMKGSPLKPPCSTGAVQETSLPRLVLLLQSLELKKLPIPSVAAVASVVLSQPKRSERDSPRLLLVKLRDR